MSLPFLVTGQCRAVAWVMLTATIIPIVDGFSAAMFLSIHLGAVLYKLGASYAGRVAE